MRIALVHPNNDDIGGSDISLLRIARACRLDGIEVVLYLGRPTGILDKYRDEGIPTRIEVLPMPRIRNTKNPLVLAEWGRRVLSTASTLHRHFRDDRIDLVLGHDINAVPVGIASKRAGLPFLNTICLTFTAPGPVRRAYLSLLARHANHIICRSRAIAEFNYHDLPGIRPKVEVIHELFDPDERPDLDDPTAQPFDRFGIPDDAPVILMPGRFEPWKGQHVLIEAAPAIFQQVPSAHIVFLGATVKARGRERYADKLNQRAEELGIAAQIHFSGHVDPILPLMRAASVIVHCSIQPEPFGLTVLEGMSVGTPVVAAAAGGPLETAGDPPVAILHTPGDAESLSEAVLKPLIDPNLVADLAHRGPQRARAFHRDALWPRFRELFARHITLLNTHEQPAQTS